MVAKRMFYFDETRARSALDTAISSDWADSEAFGTILLDFAYHAVDWLRPHHGDRDDHAMHFCTIALRYLRAGGYAPERGSLFNYLTKIASTKAFTFSAREGNISHRETTLPDNTPSQPKWIEDVVDALVSRGVPSPIVNALIEYHMEKDEKTGYLKNANLKRVKRMSGFDEPTIMHYMDIITRILHSNRYEIPEGAQLCLEL